MHPSRRREERDLRGAGLRPRRRRGPGRARPGQRPEARRPGPEPHRARLRRVRRRPGGPAGRRLGRRRGGIVQDASIDGDAANDLGKATAWPGRKLDLWRLPYDKVLYLDADTMLVDHAGTLSKSLAGLWALPLKKGEIGALSNGAGCFNGGMLLLRPAASTFGAYEAALAQNALKKTCEGHDQPLLNHVFDGAWTDLHKKWRLLKVTQSCDRLEHATPDAVHFFAASAPWRGGCRACLAENKACSHRHGLRDAACAQASLLEAQRRWWREVDARPPAARRFVDGPRGPATRARTVAPRRLCVVES